MSTQFNEPAGEGSAGEDPANTGIAGQMLERRVWTLLGTYLESVPGGGADSDQLLDYVSTGLVTWLEQDPQRLKRFLRSSCEGLVESLLLKVDEDDNDICLGGSASLN